MLWHHNMLHTSAKAWRCFIPRSAHSALGAAVSHRTAWAAPTAKDGHQESGVICLLKQTDWIPTPFYYDINNSYSVLSTLKRFNFIAVLWMFTLNFTHVSKQRLFDVNRWEARTTSLSNSKAKLYLSSPTLIRKLKMETNADFYNASIGLYVSVGK